jgi:hypothetical protein
LARALSVITIIPILRKGEFVLACPFFVPTHRADDLVLPHSARLPLGAGWRGTCAAGHEQAIPSNVELEACNLGYAKSCSRLPKVRACDAVRFGVANHSGARISLKFVFETDYLPAGHGLLEYDELLNTWVSTHPEPRIQRLAECFLQSYLERKNFASIPSV